MTERRGRRPSERNLASSADPQATPAEVDPADVVAELAGDASVELSEEFPTSEGDDQVSIDVAAEGGPSAAGWAVRRGLIALIVLGIVAMPLFYRGESGQTKLTWIAIGLIYIIFGLSINVLVGYAGQISLGHQAFVGVGAFTSAYFVSVSHLSFWLAFVLAGVSGAISAAFLGFIALRLRGLFLALITLAYGTVAQFTLFNISSLTGGGAGARAPRPAGFTGNMQFAYLCMAVAAVLLYIDWRMVRSKVGRAIFAIRENELSAASFGINITGYKLLAFTVSGVFAGLGGSLFAHQQQLVQAANFDFTFALTLVLMVVVGGLGSRVGVLIGSTFFALFPLVFNRFSQYTALIGAVLLLLTLTQFHGGIAQQIAPILRWFGGGTLRKHPRRVVRTGGESVGS
jgi:branched-chain amino acid transport system permease protein